MQLLLGISGTGKTSLILEKIKLRAENKQKSIYIVPEQFSSSAETMLFNLLGDEKKHVCRRL